jgi:hypothetical protein
MSIRVMALLGLVVTAGCGTSSENPYRRLFDAICEKSARCTRADGETLARCKATLFSGAASYDYDEAIAAGRVGVDAHAVDLCLASLGDDCKTVLPNAPECGAMLIGKVEPGGACRFSECAGGACDQGNRSVPGCAGVCRAYVAHGGACTAPKSTCTPGDYCDAASGTCVTRKTSGAVCTDANECAAGLSCKATMTMGEKRCRGLGALGDSCSSFIFDDCGNDLYCAGGGLGTGTCNARASAGASCTSPAQCPSGLTCVAAGSGATCQAPLSAGMTCVPSPQSGAPGCAGGLYCDRATLSCKNESSVIGRACSNNAECDRDASWTYCSFETKLCRALPLPNEACELPPAGQHDQCNSGTACDPQSRRCTISCS